MPKPIKIVFLGTGSCVPTLKRAHPAILFVRSGDYFFFDCGENAQVGLEKVKISPMKISKIFISHWHADHFSGLLPLIETLHLSRRKELLEVYGPEASRFMDALTELSYWGIGFEIKAKDCGEKQKEKIFENEEFMISSIKVKHSVPAVGFLFEEKEHWNIDMNLAKKGGLKAGPILDKIKKKGKVKVKGKIVRLEDIARKTKGRRIAYSGDTLVYKPFFEAVKGADLLIHDGTFIEENTRMHPSVSEVAKFAKKYKIKKLVLTHFSRRYKSLKEIGDKVKPIFKNSIVAEDGMEIVV